jgi:hypothetical protein
MPEKEDRKKGHPRKRGNARLEVRRGHLQETGKRKRIKNCKKLDASFSRSTPQFELLDRAALTITHAGMNTTLESLARGVPMVAIPITNDQPGVAARIVWTGSELMVPLYRLTPKRLRRAVVRVLGEPSFAAKRFEAPEPSPAPEAWRGPPMWSNGCSKTGRPVTADELRPRPDPGLIPRHESSEKGNGRSLANRGECIMPSVLILATY